MGKKWKQWQTEFSWSLNSVQTVTVSMKRHLLFGRKAITNLDSVLKVRDIDLPTKVPRVKAMIFSVVKYGYESWTIMKAEHRRINAFKLWSWRRVAWTTKRSHKSILKEIYPECSLEGLMWKCK